jgi:mRNA interferase YafQ
MLKLFRTKTFLKDYKKAKLSDQHYSKYIQYLSLLLKEQTLPEEALDHTLKGDYKSFKEFHISGDMLIIYIIEDSYLKLVRIGTHSQLFE